mgnify:CR=1 FL=1
MERMEAKGQFPKERLPSTRPTALSMRAGTQDSSYREDGRESPIERLTQERMKAERSMRTSSNAPAAEEAQSLRRELELSAGLLGTELDLSAYDRVSLRDSATGDLRQSVVRRRVH